MDTTEKLKSSLSILFGGSLSPKIPPNGAGEEFSNLATAVGKLYSVWFWEGIDSQNFDKMESTEEPIPVNDSPFVKSAIQATLNIIDGIPTAAMTFFDKGKEW